MIMPDVRVVEADPGVGVEQRQQDHLKREHRAAEDHDEPQEAALQPERDDREAGGGTDERRR